MRRAAVAMLAVGVALAALGAGACATTMEATEGMDTAGVPPELQADYAVFAQRCSKCHSLSRPLNSGISDDGFWHLYVEKMRRQPASGITQADTVPILRFLHWYSVSQKEKQAPGASSVAPLSPAPGPPSLAPGSPPPPTQPAPSPESTTKGDGG